MRDAAVSLCGLELKNPVISASGTYGLGWEFKRLYDVSLLGGIGLKAVTLEGRQGNPPPRIAETPSGMLNSVGLQNSGIDAFLRHALPQIQTLNTVLVANVAGKCIEDYVEVAQRLNGAGVHMLEINVSCPNVRDGTSIGTDANTVKQLTMLIKAVSDKPVIVKLTPNVTDITKIAEAAEAGGADAVSLINTITGMAVDPYARRPILGNVTGGLSGPAVKPIALRMVYETARAVSIPVIGMGGIMSGEDVAEFMLCGATAVMVGTANIAEPAACVRIINEFQAYLKKTGAKARELTGALKV